MKVTQVSIDRFRISKMWSIHAMEYYSGLESKEILICAVTWMNVEDMMLSEISRHNRRNTV